MWFIYTSNKCILHLGQCKIERVCYLCSGSSFIHPFFNIICHVRGDDPWITLRTAQRGRQVLLVSQLRGWRAGTRVFTQDRDCAYSSWERERFKGKAAETSFVPWAIYVPPRRLKPSSLKPALALVNLMPVLVHLPAIWSESINPLGSLKAPRVVIWKLLPSPLPHILTLCSHWWTDELDIFLRMLPQPEGFWKSTFILEDDHGFAC